MSSRFEWVLYYTHKNAQVVTGLQTSLANLFTSCRQVVFALLAPSCCNKLLTTCNKLDGIYRTCFKVVLTSLHDTIMI